MRGDPIVEPPVLEEAEPLEPPREQGAVPEGPGRAVAVMATLAMGAALAVAASRPAPRDPVVTTEPPPGDEGEEEPIPVAPPALLRVVAGLRSDDPAVRRETAGVVERLAADPDASVRWDLVAALVALGGRESRLPLSLLAGDGERRVRLAARRALRGRSRPPW